TSRMLPRVLWRPAILFFAISQFVLAFAPLLEGRFGPDARAHAEEAGTNIHHAHNDADCAACTARDLMASAEPGSTTSTTATSVAVGTFASTERSDEFSRTSQTQSRAPPSV
ncbi:MAG: hypothetical protein ABJC63_14875, partial [Gemmatimonadales bacterium]